MKQWAYVWLSPSQDSRSWQPAVIVERLALPGAYVVTRGETLHGSSNKARTSQWRTRPVRSASTEVDALILSTIRPILEYAKEFAELRREMDLDAGLSHVVEISTSLASDSDDDMFLNVEWPNYVLSASTLRQLAELGLQYWLDPYFEYK